MSWCITIFSKQAIEDISGNHFGLFFPVQIHWLSIINSVVLVFLLIGFVVIILVIKHTVYFDFSADM